MGTLVLAGRSRALAARNIAVVDLVILSCTALMREPPAATKSGPSAK